MNELKQGAYWTYPANQVVWGWVERYHVGIGCWGENMRVRIEDRKEAWELVPERTCNVIQHGSLVIEESAPASFRCWSCSECSYGWHVSDYDKPYSYCPNCGAKVVDA